MSMKPLELIDQMLSRTPFSCTKKQMRFLRDLVASYQNTDVIREAERIHSRKIITALKQELTRARKSFEAAEETLSDHIKEHEELYSDARLQVKKVPALTCPQCKSTKVSQDFTGEHRGRLIKATGKIYCYGCKKVTTKAGKVIPFEKQDWCLDEAAQEQVKRAVAMTKKIEAEE